LSFDVQLVVDPFTLTVVLLVLETVRRLGKRVQVLENLQTYNRGFTAGETAEREVKRQK
jgi:hypothetical protein